MGALGSCARPIERLCPEIVSYRSAVDGADEMYRLIGHALGYLTADIPTFMATYVLIDLYPGIFAAGPCVIKADSADRSDVASLYARFVESAHLDPLAQRAAHDASARLVGMDEVGGAEAYYRSEFGRTFRELGIGPRLRLILREDARPVATIGLIRRLGEPDFDDTERNFLWASHEFLEAVHVIAVRKVRAQRNLRNLARRHRLSARELQIIELVLGGASNTTVAEEFGITVGTVRRHLRHIYRKLGVPGRAELGPAIVKRGDIGERSPG